jgi:hypothetical protein
MTPKLKREVRRRSAIEPVIGHMKAEHRMGRNYLWYPQCDAINAALAAAGYNFSPLRNLAARAQRPPSAYPGLKTGFFTDD